MEANQVSAIVLAAGSSRRMGRNKLCETIGGETVLRHALKPLLEIPLFEIVVVTGFESERVSAMIGDMPLRIQFNAGFDQGMGATIRAGVRAAKPSNGGILLVLGDMPFVPLLHYERIVGSFQRLQTPDALVVSSSGETIGPPVLFGPRYRPQLEEMSGESGARAIIQANESQMTVVMGQEGWFRDLDGPEDFEINPLMNR